MQILVKAVPIKQGHTLRIIWPITPSIHNYKEGPCRYLGHLIGHEGEGSLFYILKTLGNFSSPQLYYYSYVMLYLFNGSQHSSLFGMSDIHVKLFCCLSFIFWMKIICYFLKYIVTNSCILPCCILFFQDCTIVSYCTGSCLCLFIFSILWPIQFLFTCLIFFSTC